MDFNSKRIALVILGLTAIFCSRTFFYFINDPEGPNLLIVMVLAVIVYISSLTAYLYMPRAITNKISMLLAFLVQVLLIAGLYVILH